MMTSTLRLFFSNGVEIVNQENLPQDGPLIIVGNHFNQFIDPMVLLKAAKRQVSFIIAEKSMHRPVIGDFARMLQAVPVVRAQDKATPGKGLVVSVDLEARVIIGEASNFREEFSQQGSMLSLKAVGEFMVEKVVSDTELLFKKIPDDKDKQPSMENFKPNSPFKVVPKISQDEVFNAVYERLGNNGCIGIFPEGGSHDNTELLPLKAGVTQMALGAAAKGTKVRIVAVGINYFAGHTFRSKAFVDISRPLEIDEVLIEKFKNGGKREAMGTLLTQVQDLLQGVTIRAPNYDILKATRTMRRMFQGPVKLDKTQYIALCKRFSMGYDQWKENSDFMELLTDTHVYLKFAFAQGLTDKQVRDLPPLGKCSTYMRAWLELLKLVILVLFVLPLMLPGLILNLPIYLRTQCIVHAEMKKALAGSTVKLAARDVVASQKVITVAKLVPTLYILYTTLLLVLLLVFWPIEEQNTGEWHDFLANNGWWLISLLFLFVFPIYTFYLCVVVGTSVNQRLKMLPSYLLMITSICKQRSRNPAEMLRDDRKRLVIRVQQFVEAHIHEIPDWEQHRIIEPSEITSRRSARTLQLMESGDLTPRLASNQSSTLSFSKSFDDINPQK